MKRALVTGGSGFLGRHLIKALKAHQFSVHTLSFRGGADTVLQGPDDASGMKTALQNFTPDVVFHLAGCAHSEDPTDLFRINVLYGVNLITAIKSLHSKTHFIAIGSLAEFGAIDEKQLPVREDTAQGQLLSIYGLTKRQQTEAVKFLCDRILPYTIIRFSNLVGSKTPEHLLLGRVIAQATRAKAEGQCSIRLGDLSATRDFLDVRTAAEALCRLALNPSAQNQICNVGSGIEIACETLVAAALKKWFPDLNYSMSEPVSKGINRIYVDPTLARRLTGLPLTFDLNKTIEDLFQERGV